jgi:acetylornithine deacetylase
VSPQAAAASAAAAPARAASEDLLAQATGLLADLVAFPTVSADSNLEMIDYVAARLAACGAQIELQHDDTGRKANLFATIGPLRDGGLVLSGHSDVVPVTDQPWSTDPFSLVTRDGRLHGRGTCDMKGFLAACLAMAPRFAALPLARPVHFAVTFDEEVGCLGARHLARRLSQTGLRPRMALVGEPTQMRIVEGHKGCCEYSVHFHGLEGHGSDPAGGVNAVEFAARYVAKLLTLRDALQARAPADSRFAPPWTTLNVGALHGGSVHNVIAPRAQVDWEMRPVQDADRCLVLETMAAFCDDALLPAMRAVWPDARIETEVIGEVAGLTPMPANAAREVLGPLLGQNAADLVPFGTEAGIFQDLGMDVVVCGPGSIAQAHKADEYLELSELRRCLDMLDGLAARLAA